MITGIIGHAALPGLTLDRQTNQESYETIQTTNGIQSSQDRIKDLNQHQIVQSVESSEQPRQTRLLDVSA